jgi:hypothetical protein
MVDERVVRSVAQAEGAVKKVPSLALALFPQPELLVAGDSWLAASAVAATTGGKALNTADPSKDSTERR